MLVSLNVLYAISEKLLNLGNTIILEQKQDISAGLSNAFFGDFHGKNPMN